MLGKKIGIDLGTANTLVFVSGRGLVINEPTVLAVTEDNKILAVGQEAKKMLGRAPSDLVQAVRPLREGVIADFRLTQAMLTYFINKALGRVQFFKPEVLVAVPAGITSAERRAAIEATLKAGAKAVYLVKEPLLAAIGAGVPINNAQGNLIIDSGGGTSETAAICLGGIVAANSSKTAGDKINQAIVDYIKKKHGLFIGDHTAEMIKIKIGSALPQKKEDSLMVRGRDLKTGLPKDIEIFANEITEAIRPQLKEIAQTVKRVLQETPPEIIADIMDKGMILAGGGANLKNLDLLLEKATGITCFVAEKPLLCVVKGAGLVLEHLAVYKRSLISSR